MLAYLTWPPAFWILILSSYTEGLCSVVSGIGMQELSSFCRHKTAYWKKQKPWTCTQLGWYFQLYIKGFFINVQVSNFLYNKFIDLMDRNETLFEGDRGGSLGLGRGSWYGYFKMKMSWFFLSFNVTKSTCTHLPGCLQAKLWTLFH